MAPQRADVVVLGAGPAGEVVAGRLADRTDKHVVLIEQELVGGECSFWACMPSKALLRPEQALAEARRVPGAAEALTGELDTVAALARRDEVIHDLDDSVQLPWLEDRGIELVRGRGVIAGERRVRVGDTELEVRDAVVVATGSGPAIPPIPGLREAAAWSNREITTARDVPGSLVILGGGVVGVEMAWAWSSLGARVTLLEAGERVIGHEEDVASVEVREALEARGVTVRCRSKVTAVERTGTALEPGYRVTLADGEVLGSDRMVVAIGRRPHVSGLGLAELGLPEDRPLAVDAQMRVCGHPWLFAVGDVNGRALLTHAGKYQARIAADVIAGLRASAWADIEATPRVIFTEPQVAAVGLTAAKAREQGLEVHVIDVRTGGNAGGSFVGKGAPGTSRFVIDASRGVIVGATITGVDVSEFIHAATIAVVGEVPLRRLAHAIPSFPTRSELWLKLVERVEEEGGESLHAGPR